MADQLFEYDELGNITFSGLDLSGSGTLVAASTDRLQENQWGYETISVTAQIAIVFLIRLRS